MIPKILNFEEMVSLYIKILKKKSHLIKWDIDIINVK